jgi:hypothetical protein
VSVFPAGVVDGGVKGSVEDDVDHVRFEQVPPCQRVDVDKILVRNGTRDMIGC